MSDALLKVSVNPLLVDKRPPADKRSFSVGFKPHDLTIRQLVEVVREFGYAFSYRFANGIRKTENFLGADFLAVDIDSGLTIEQALANRIVQQYGSLLYTTASHTSERHRFRLVFALPYAIVDAKELRAASVSLARRLGGDLSATDAARLFYGATRCHIELLGNALSESFLRELIADGRVIAASDSIARSGLGVTSRSQLKLERDRIFTTADRKKIRIANVTKTTSVYCPFHPDDHPSAFISIGPTGRTFFRCSACQLTRYMEGEAEDVYDFNSFEKAMQAFKNGAEPKPSAEYQIFLRHLKGFIDLKSADIRFTHTQYLRLSRIYNGLTLIKSPKGSGKTHYLINALKDVLFTHGEKANSLKFLEEETDSDEPYFTKKRVLLIGHRQALIRELCQRLGLNCYLNDPVVWRAPSQTSDFAGRYVSPISPVTLPRYGVCLDSLWRVKDQTYDVILMDESEQLLSHFLSDTIGEERYKLFEQLKGLISRATSVVALDADLGWATANTLLALWRQGKKGAMKPQRLAIYVNESKKTGEPIHLYVTRDHLFQKLNESLVKRERIFVASNSKTKIKALAASIANLGKKLKRRLKIIMITSENSKTKAVQHFITNIKQEILKYDVILASPSLGTGVDITFENNAKEIDSVYGIFENLINSHTEIDQQLARVRHPKEVHVWVSPQWFNFETDLVVTKEDFRRNNFNAVAYAALSQTDDDEDPFITMAATITAFQRASKNRLRQNFIEYKKTAGWTIIDVPYDERAGKAGRKFYNLGLRIATQEEIDAVLNAKPMNTNEVADFRNRWNRNYGEVTLAEKYSYYRNRIEKFYGVEIDAKLIELDDQGSLREKVRAFEAISSPEYIRRLIGRREEYWKGRSGQERGEVLIPDRISSQILLYELFSHTPVFKEGRFSVGVVYQSCDLRKFAKFVRDMKPYIENHLRMSVQSDLNKKPVQMLRKLLKCVGLTHWKFRPKVVNGVKTYIYHVCPKRLRLLRGICQARAKATTRNRRNRIPIVLGVDGDLGSDCLGS